MYSFWKLVYKKKLNHLFFFFVCVHPTSVRSHVLCANFLYRESIYTYIRMYYCLVPAQPFVVAAIASTGNAKRHRERKKRREKKHQAIFGLLPRKPPISHSRSNRERGRNTACVTKNTSILLLNKKQKLNSNDSSQKSCFFLQMPYSLAVH